MNYLKHYRCNEDFKISPYGTYSTWQIRKTSDEIADTKFRRNHPILSIAQKYCPYIILTHTTLHNKRKGKNPKSKKNKGARSLCNQKRYRRWCVKNPSLQNQILFFDIILATLQRPKSCYGFGSICRMPYVCEGACRYGYYFLVAYNIVGKFYYFLAIKPYKSSKNSHYLLNIKNWKRTSTFKI